VYSLSLLQPALGLIPVLLFVIGLVILDSFKLVTPGATIGAIVTGCAVALVLLVIHTYLVSVVPVSEASFSRYIAPVTEEIGKALFIYYLVRAQKVGFMVDAAIFGFAVGAGFALVENIYYLWTLAEFNPLIWIVRGFGTAVMHGGTTAIFAIVTKSLSDRYASSIILPAVPGLILAIVIHSVFNHFIIIPVYTTIVTLVVLPVLFVVIFHRSEEATRNWLGYGLDKDVELLRMIIAGNISGTRIGHYLQTLQEKFPGMIVADMLNYLRIYLELSVRAKGILIMHESGYRVPIDPEIQERFSELKFLEKSIGKIGKRALHPFLNLSNRDLWQLHMLNKKQTSSINQRRI
jgi:protease PrsW